METGSHFLQIEQGKCHSQLQKRSKGQSGQLQAIQSHFHPWENQGVNILEIQEAREGDWEQPTWTYQRYIMPHQFNCLLR